MKEGEKYPTDRQRHRQTEEHTDRQTDRQRPGLTRQGTKRLAARPT